MKKLTLLSIAFLLTIVASAQNAPKVSYPTININASCNKYGSSASILYNNTEKTVRCLSKLFVDKVSSPESVDIFFYDNEGTWQREVITDFTPTLEFGIDLAKDATITLTFTGISEFEEVYFIDALNEVTYKVEEGDQILVDVESGENKDRFSIAFNNEATEEIPTEGTGEENPTTDVNQTQSNDLVVYTDGSNIIVSSPEVAQTNVTIYNISGRMVKSAVVAGYASIDMSNCTKGAYIVNTFANNKIVSTKVIL